MLTSIYRGKIWGGTAVSDADLRHAITKSRGKHGIWWHSMVTRLRTTDEIRGAQSAPRA